MTALEENFVEENLVDTSMPPQGVAQSERERRAAKNQSLFREVNERVKEVNDRHHIALTLTHWLCECADETCTERIALSPREYESLREISTRFVIAPQREHFVPDVERIVRRHGRYWVVEKEGEAASVADDLDPRSRGDGQS
jgi:hypothetical protein